MSASTCPSCCNACSTTPLISTTAHTSKTPYALSNLLQAGTVEIMLMPESLTCSHSHAEDGWHLLNEINLEGKVQTVSNDLLRSLQILTTHLFLIATYCVSSTHSDQRLVIRIYLIPYDLPGVNGCLSSHIRRRENSPVLSIARRHMSYLLPQICQDQQSWTFGVVRPKSPSIISDLPDHRSLSEIYSNLPSPKPGRRGNSSLVTRLLNFGDPLDDLGLRSTSQLHGYQRRSVAAMLEHEESDNMNTPNPLYLSLKGMDGCTFYYQPGTTEILREQSVVSLSRGGVLCEELGTGKTIIVLALVLGTRKQLSRPEESLIDPRPILTPLAFRHFPSGEFSVVRERFPRRARTTVMNSGFRIPSLSELLLHQLSSNPQAAMASVTMQEKQQKLLEKFDLTTFASLRNSNPPFYFHFQDDYTLTNSRISTRKRTDPGPRAVYLSVATLIVVPPNLISQWDREIHKHSEETLRLLIVRSKTDLPRAKDLATQYDVILMTYSRFCDEDRRANIANAHTWKVCKCPEIVGFRVPECKCSPPDISPLLQVRWKRLVIDEGHISSSLSTRFTPFARLLSVQARWIVTGTPTTNLLGLSFGESGMEKSQIGTLEHSQPIESNSELEDVSSDGDPDELPLDDSCLTSARIWSASDNRDINKLMNMVSQFIGAKFLADSQVVRTHIKDALFTEKGPLPGGIGMLVQVMNTTMIRHQISDVEKEITLPKLTQESVLLDLDPLMIISYNALLAAILINAIDSERTDRDYLFHPSNAEYLQLTVRNMSQMMFWSVDSKLYGVEEMVKHTEELLYKVKDGIKHISEHDITQAQKALKHSRLACQASLWRQIQMHEDIPYHVLNVPPAIIKEWSRLPGHLIHSGRLLQLQQRVHRYPLTDDLTLCSMGQQISKIESQNHLILEELEQKKGKQKEKAKQHNPSSVTATGKNELKTRTAEKNASFHDRIREMQKDLQASLARLDVLEEIGGVAVSESESPNSLKIKIPVSLNQNSTLLHQSPVAHAHVWSTASSKLNYILEEVQRYSSEEKFLIFSESPLTLSHIYDALTLLQIKSLQFTTQTSTLVREQFVLTFETSTNYRVFLMELKHGARGLNLVSASRVIFCEPVWQADVESQAIKRAHRIGQSRPVTVKTLVIRGTAEEKMLERRQKLKNIPGNVPKLLEETGMRHFIANPEFIESSTNPGVVIPRVDFPLFHLPGLDGSTQSSTGHKRVREEDSPQQKKKVVRFI
ncbi:hypothetical protein J3R30DRAFT_3444646 [Lentinula aciculospora]|uniref:P-loop containing nucleoside triphosphate hydrolase protein n=1 Tax=Lentinula aciculospora TaxID=153920 RepID=A0A9W9ANQ2_9AGAR|nr:hypothetical protein J3R30DRAFT_3444646 [Lentinula aciculospora]